jgi:signal transduction histidine kinase
VLAAALASGIVTTFVALWPTIGFTAREPALHVASETAGAIIALVAAFLIAGRFAHRRRLDDLLLAQALGLFAMTNLFFGAILVADDHGLSSRFATWTAFEGRLLGAVVFAIAAVAPARSVRARFALWSIAVFPAAVLAAAASATALLQESLPIGVKERLAAEGTVSNQLDGHPVLLAGQVLLVALFLAASVGFTRRAGREHSRLIAGLAVASVFGAFARLNYFLYPSLYSDWVHTGDGFRLAYYVMILIAAAREITTYWRARMEVAVLEERRRIARDLHDGVAQELAFIRRNLRRLDRDSGVKERIEAATARALDESRDAIAILAEVPDDPFETVLAEAALDVAAREGGRVVLSLAPGVEVTPAQREGLVRIASEAITNAIRHGGAKVVRVRLTGRNGVRLSVIDTGRGFDPDTVPPGRFGLIGMQQRAEAVGGRLRLRSTPGEGTHVEVVL